MDRPRSPHLQIYHVSMTMMMSIAHRLSGLALYGIMFGVIIWLALLAFTPEFFKIAQIWLSTLWGRTVLFLSLWSFCHHLFGGLRHFLWDLGYGLGVYGREWLVWGNFILGLLSASAIFWGPDYEMLLEKLG